MSFKSVSRNIYHWIVPFSVRKKIDYKRRKKWYKLSKIVENYYKGKENPPEIKESLSFLHNNHFNLNEIRFLYLSKITDKYIKKYATLPVHYDKTFDLPYIYHDGKPLYYPKDMDAIQIRGNYSMFLPEMDNKSPHLYCKNPHELQGRILFDCGVAEGLFPLTYIDAFEKKCSFRM